MTPNRQPAQPEGGERVRGPRQPERTCIGCRTRRESSALVRFVLDDGLLVLDSRRRLPGRGAWLCPQRPCLDKALRKRAFNRAFGTDVKIDKSDLLARFESFEMYPDSR